MKRVPLIRKTPLKSHSQFKPKIKTKIIKPFPEAKIPIQKPRRGLLGHGRTQSHILLHSMIAETGCFACLYLNTIAKSKLCIHHPRGRNKGKDYDVNEEYVICLCQEHHDSTLCNGFKGPSIHGNKKLFLELIGIEAWCVLETYKMISSIPPWLAPEEWLEYSLLQTKEDQHEWIINFESDPKRLKKIN